MCGVVLIGTNVRLALVVCLCCSVWAAVFGLVLGSCICVFVFCGWRVRRVFTASC